MNRTTGEPIKGLAYLRQRFEDAFTTRIGDLVCARDYGSGFDDLIDQNITPAFRLRVFNRALNAIQNPVNGLDDITPQTFELRESEPNTVLLVSHCLWNNQAVELTAGLPIGSVS